MAKRATRNTKKTVTRRAAAKRTIPTDGIAEALRAALMAPISTPDGTPTDIHLAGAVYKLSLAIERLARAYEADLADGDDPERVVPMRGTDAA